MCGIIAYIGHKDAYPIIMKILRSLEYRGYDSTGIALLDTELKVHKKAKKVTDLENSLKGIEPRGRVGMGHTRWAVYGEANDANAHPHLSSDNKLAIIHNGIIKNYLLLKEELLNKGHIFQSDTDSEVLIHLIEDVQNQTGLDLHKAVSIALKKVTGTYAIVIMDADEPDRLITARKGSPLAIGSGNGEYFITSDAAAIEVYAENMIYLEDNQIARVGDYYALIDNME